MAHTLCWFDLSVKDLNRAVTFYRSVLACKLEVYSYEGVDCAVFAHQENDVAGCLVERAEFQPVSDALLVYFSVEGRLDEALVEVEKCGGKIIAPKTSIGPHGFRAVIVDSEGNHIALHSMTA
jgi:predicted enzyme related to lactoylglutathione lyase